MKSIKTIIIAGIVLLVFVVASVILINIPAVHSNDSSVQEESSVETASTETVYIVDRDSETLDRFVVVPTKREVGEDTAYAYASEALEVDVKRTENDKGSVSYDFDVSPDPGEFEYSSSMFRSMTYTLSSITATALVEEDAKDLSAYGLDEPTAVIETYYSDGSQVDIIIGSQAPVDEAYYCMTNESNNVYTIGSYVDSLLVRRPIEYRDITLFPTYEEEDIYTNISKVRLTERDGSVIAVELDENQENENNTEGSQYVMLEPYQVSGNASTIQQNILDVVATLQLGSIIKDISEDEYGEYGLDHPAKLEMWDVADNEVHLLVGDTCPNPDYVYCMLEGTNTLLTCTSSAMGWMGQNYVQFMLRTVWCYNIEELKSIDIQIDDEKYDLQVEHFTKKNANGNDTDGVKGTLNGQELEAETNIRRLFVRCLYFRVVDNLTEDEKKEFKNTDPYATITLNLESGEHTLELIPISDRKYAMRVDGEMEYYCYKKSLEELEKSLTYVLEGDELDFNFG